MSHFYLWPITSFKNVDDSFNMLLDVNTPVFCLQNRVYKIFKPMSYFQLHSRLVKNTSLHMPQLISGTLLEMPIKASKKNH